MGRLYVVGRFLGFQRSLVNQRTQTSLLSVDGVQTMDDAKFYLGKRVAYVYKGKTKHTLPGGKRSVYRVIWGRVTRTHGNSGVVRAKFQTNLPARAMGSSVRIMLYPSSI